MTQQIPPPPPGFSIPKDIPPPPKGFTIQGAGQPSQQPQQTNMGQKILGGLDATGVMASGLAMDAIGGWLGMAQGVNPWAKEGASADMVKWWQDHAYKSDYPATQNALSAVGGAAEGAGDFVNYLISPLAGVASLVAGEGTNEAMQTVADVQNKGIKQVLGDKVYENTGSEFWAAGAYTLPDALLSIIGVKGAKELRATSGMGKVSNSPLEALSQAAPELVDIRKAASELYKRVDDAGFKIDQNEFLNLAIKINDETKKLGLDANLTPESISLLKRIEKELGNPDMTISNLDQIRKVASVPAVNIANPVERSIGISVKNMIDDFIETQGIKAGQELGTGVAADITKARELWSRVKKKEVLDEAMYKAELQASGFENGMRTQLRSILNSPKKRMGFTDAEQAAMRTVIKGGTAENFFKGLGKIGMGDNTAHMLLPLLAGGGTAAAVGGTLGLGAGVASGVAVLGVGKVSMKLAEKLTANNLRFANDLVSAGKDGQKIVNSYLKHVPAANRTTEELTQLLLRPGVTTETIKGLDTAATKSIIQDAVFYADKMKSMGMTSMFAVPSVEKTTNQRGTN